MRIRDGRLDPKDFYETEWIGGKGGGGEQTIGDNGKWVIGIHGRQGLDLDAIGLVSAPPAGLVD